MRKNTVITLGASFVFGVLAVALARGWIDDAIETEFKNSTLVNEVNQVKNLNLIPVVIMDSDQQFGDRLTPDIIRVVEVPADAVPLGAFKSSKDIFIDPSKPTIILTGLKKNEIILSDKISGPGAKGSLSAIIEEGMRAVSVRVNDVAGVAGYVMPGDRVDILYTWDQQSRRNGNNLQSDVLLQNVKVLGIDQNMNENAAAPDIAKTVTLEVSVEDAQKLHLASDAGKLSLTLRSMGDNQAEAARTVHQSSLITRAKAPAANGGPKLPKRPKVKPLSKSDPTAQVTVVRGDKTDQVKVLRETETVKLAER